MKHNEKGYIEAILAVLAVVAIIAVVVFIGWISIYFQTNHHEKTFTVVKTERVVDQNGHGARYLVYTDDGTFEDTDSFFNSKFNSSDIYGQIQVGHKYTCDLVGFRNGFWSNYENIISCKDTSKVGE